MQKPKTARRNSVPRSDKKYHTDEERRVANAEKAKRCYRKDPARARANWDAYSQTEKGRATVLLSQARTRAKSRDLPFDLDHAWVARRIRKGVCAVSGLPFSFDKKGAQIGPFTPSIDKIKPHLGYVKSNCRLVCFAVNVAKQDWSDRVLLKVARAIVSQRVRLVT